MVDKNCPSPFHKMKWHFINVIKWFNSFWRSINNMHIQYLVDMSSLIWFQICKALYNATWWTLLLSDLIHVYLPSHQQLCVNIYTKNRLHWYKLIKYQMYMYNTESLAYLFSKKEKYLYINNSTAFEHLFV